MLDLHTHVLPDVDDGVRSLDEAVALVRAAAEEGVTALAATPHVRDDYPTSAQAMESGVAAVRDAVLRAGIDVRILHGGEIDVDWIWRLAPEELRRFTIGQTGRYLLVETPYRRWPRTLERACALLEGRGVTPILAHPERNPHVQDRPSIVEPLVGRGALVQVTSGSLDGRLGAAAQLAARTLVERGLVHVVASDAHGPDVRAYGLAAGVSALDPVVAQRLATDTPEAIAAGDPV